LEAGAWEARATHFLPLKVDARAPVPRTITDFDIMIADILELLLEEKDTECEFIT